MATNWQSYNINEAVDWFPSGHDAGRRTAFPACSAVMYVKSKNKIDYPGISLNFDAVINGGGSFYTDSRSKTTIYIDIGFHHISDSSVNPDSTWHWVNDVAVVDVLRSPLVHSGAWGYSDEDKKKPIKPYYGWRTSSGDPRNFLYEVETGTAGSGSSEKRRYYTDSEITSMTYSAVKSILNKNGAKPIDRSGGGARDDYKDYINPETIGIRYMSNGINWSRDRRHQPGFTYNLAAGSNPGYKKDPGPGKNLINISARAGVGHDRYCIRLRMDSNHSHSNIWYHPTGTNFKVDNALLGNPDWNNWPGNTAPENWPVRYDAKFFKVEGGSWKRVDAAGKRKSGDWKVF